tara:strand:+ start:3677 stop:4216 length:540 start_codon:yes stop_codon:yes gene_type:complete
MISIKDNQDQVTVTLFSNHRFLFAGLIIVVLLGVLSVALKDTGFNLSINQLIMLFLLVLVYLFFIVIFGSLFFGKTIIEKTKKSESYAITLPLILFPLKKKYVVDSKLKEVDINKVWKQNFYLDQQKASLVFENGKTVSLYPKSLDYFFAFINFRTAFDLRKEEIQKMADVFNAKVISK